MPINQRRKKQARLLRQMRAIHRTLGISLVLFMAIISISGLLLGWKKNSNGYILAKTERGTSSDLSEWLPMDSLYHIATTAVTMQYPHLSHEVDRIDVRPSRGVVKFTFDGHHQGVQIDGATGDILSYEYRRSDLIENIHDGSIVDDWLGAGGYFKLVYTSTTGLALLAFSITGFWLWYGPIRMRRMGRRED